MRKFNATQQLIIDSAKDVYKKIGYRRLYLSDDCG